jgi:hypothetical protein
MKKRLLIPVFFIYSIFIFLKGYAGASTQLPATICASNPSDTLTNQLSALNLSEYNGKPVDSLLAHLPAGYTTLKIGGWRSQRLAEVLYILYPNNISVGIHVRHFQFMNPHLDNTPNPAENWNITLFKKEAIYFTIIFKGPVCINGCENENK